MTDLSTLAGQHAHYTSIRQRLMSPGFVERKPKPRAWSYAPAPLPVKPAVPYVEPAKWKQILIEVAHKHRCNVGDITGSSRAHDILPARHEAAYRMAHELRMDLAGIGRRIGGRNYKTILNSVSKHALSLAKPKKRDFIIIPSSGNENAHLIIAQVAARYGVTVPQITGDMKSIAVSLARDEALYLCSTQTHLSQRAIGMLFNNRDHSTVSKAVARHMHRLATERMAA